MSKIKQIWRKTLTGFAPVNDEAQRLHKRIALGSDVASNMRVPRNLRFHNKYFKLLSIAFENQDKHESFEWFRREIMYKLGRVEWGVIAGTEVWQAESISFGSDYDDIKFEKLYSETITVILRDFLNGTTEAEIRSQVEQIVGFA
jgi:hypothetical protein